MNKYKVIGWSIVSILIISIVVLCYMASVLWVLFAATGAALLIAILVISCIILIDGENPLDIFKNENKENKKL